jgi:hypothetical protein
MPDEVAHRCADVGRPPMLGDTAAAESMHNHVVPPMREFRQLGGVVAHSGECEGRISFATLRLGHAWVPGNLAVPETASAVRGMTLVSGTGSRCAKLIALHRVTCP